MFDCNEEICKINCSELMNIYINTIFISNMYEDTYSINKNIVCTYFIYQNKKCIFIFIHLSSTRQRIECYMLMFLSIRDFLNHVMSWKI